MQNLRLGCDVWREAALRDAAQDVYSLVISSGRDGDGKGVLVGARRGKSALTLRHRGRRLVAMTCSSPGRLRLAS